VKGGRRRTNAASDRGRIAGFSGFAAPLSAPAGEFGYSAAEMVIVLLPYKSRGRCMSYDLRLFLARPDVEDPLQTARAEESEEINPGPPIAAKEARKQEIATALAKTDPALKVFQFGFDEIAKFQRITVEEAKVRFRQMELNGPEDGPGIQITLLDDGASLTVPYWHKGKKAKAVFAKIWEYLLVIQKISGYQVYDPQFDRIIDLMSDLNEVTKRYTDIVARVW
jgi:hypothetical protein